VIDLAVILFSVAHCQKVMTRDMSPVWKRPNDQENSTFFLWGVVKLGEIAL